MAKANILNTRTINYMELIGNGKLYRVPSYQRDYSWSQEQWEDLWNDIVELQPRSEDRHYMGALVVEGRSDREFLVIDGQQRLATLSLFALAVNEKMHQDFALFAVPTRGPRKKLAKYILARLEGDAANRYCDPDTDPGTIEHILPENPTEAWSDTFALERWEVSMYRLGNLTLLEAAANRTVGNAAYADKCAAYNKSSYVLTKRIPEIAPEQWTPELVDERQRQLAARAVHLWRSDFA